MPIYEYECGKCAAHHEFLQKISDGPKTECPDCGGKLHKLISMNSFQLKGSGWYADGYSSQSTKAPGADSNAKPTEQKPASSTGCSAPASSPEP